MTDTQRLEEARMAFDMLEKGTEMLANVGFRLVFDSYADSGLYAVPADVDFGDRHGDDPREDAGEFLADCPVALSVEGVYNDGTRVADRVPDWWHGWSRFTGKGA